MVIKPVKTIATLGLAAFAAMSTGVSGAFAAQPKPMEMWHQPAATEVMDYIAWFDEYTLWFLVPIVLLVLGLLIWVGVRFRAGANPEPSKTSHNTLIETVWTVGPILVLVMFAIPSFDLLDKQLAPTEEPQMTIKVTGHQWYWSYEYQDGADISFDALMLRDEKEREDAGKTDMKVYPRLLATDNDVVVPVDTMVRVLVTSEDVIHSFAVPSYGIKIDAIPGRMNETWFKVREPGMYYGQCSELCDGDHAFMPIAVRAVTKEQYDKWKAAAAEDVDAANKELMAAIDSEKTEKVAERASEKEADAKMASNAANKASVKE